MPFMSEHLIRRLPQKSPHENFLQFCDIEQQPHYHSVKMQQCVSAWLKIYTFQSVGISGVKLHVNEERGQLLVNQLVMSVCRTFNSYSLTFIPDLILESLVCP